MAKTRAKKTAAKTPPPARPRKRDDTFTVSLDGRGTMLDMSFCPDSGEVCIKVKADYPVRQILVGGRAYVHKRETQDGRWTYRPLGRRP